MKQVVQNLKNGKTRLVNVPLPNIKKGQIQIQTSVSLISSGTEKMLMNFGKANYVNKIIQQPDKFKIAINKMKTDGIKPTLEAIFNKLDQPLPLGYCNVGTIIEMDKDIKNFKVGDRVVSNGFHADVVNVPSNLCVKIPDSVSQNEAVFSILGSIALQGVRLINPNIGEKIVVMGLGTIGLLTTQLLISNGCSVLAVDLDNEKLKLAESYGAKIFNLEKNINFTDFANNFSNGYGVDGVLLTLSTKSSDPIHQSAEVLRKRGRIVLVGTCGLNFSREDFYKKEISFQVSSSYGPGRYEANYENKGLDYPIEFVRWTANRNIESFLYLLSEKKINVSKLISNKFSINNAEKAYETLFQNTSNLGIILEYEILDPSENKKTISLNKEAISFKNEDRYLTNVIGSGNYASSVLIPLFKKKKFNLNNIASMNGLSATHNGVKFGFNNSTTDLNKIFKDNSNIIVIASRHDTHAEFILNGMKERKNIFVEKPLCLNRNELDEITKNYETYYNDTKKILLVGFNRRFSKFSIKIKKLLESVKSPKSFLMTINAGRIDKDSWIHDKKIGGGRLIGEACHFIDLLRFLSESSINNYQITSIDEENFSLNLSFNDGSIGVINYFSNGSKSYQKERLEIFTENKILQLNNFKSLVGYGWSNFSKMKSLFQDKGQKECVNQFYNSIKNSSTSPIPFEEIREVTDVCINASLDLS